ncbi:exocyst complex component EXO70H1-like isoform X2 [Rhodamnia argentea]|uniref:Exocyst subunit Exo70 family protein n=1 Tax=Rhodamnia argentea TaxID=178133 RepID=A0A8B8NHW5_9MYRT|nr:exocyst complex component EXO70H1-like isoform X2 [Rhodamnia argentea]
MTLFTPFLSKKRLTPLSLEVTNFPEGLPESIQDTMPRKGMRSICFSPRTPSFASPSRGPPARSPLSGPAAAEADKVIEAAALLIMKWNPDTSTYARVTSLFYESKREAAQFITCVNNLQKSMHALASANSAADERLVHAQFLMEIAMKRLQKEFYQILSLNRAHLDPESVSARSSRASARSSISEYSDDGNDEACAARDSIAEVEEASTAAMSDLRSIAECMIASGYGKECVSIYNIIRKSIVDEGIYRLGVERLSTSQVTKMDWDVLEMKVKNWLGAVKIAIRSLFTGERILCDHVFASSDSIRESCFAEISRDGAMILFGFPESVVRSKRSPEEKMFRLLDMYLAISESWPDIESIFAFVSTSTVRSQTLTSLARLSESAHSMLSDFEAAVQKDSRKSSPPVAGGGVHTLTVRTMNYLTLLADYGSIVGDIFADWPGPAKSSMPESCLDTAPESDDAPAISLRLTWLILVLLCKLDGKAKRYKDVATAYLFLANNLQHVVSKVRASNLQDLLGEEWVAKHESKVKQYTGNYERLAWSQVFASLPESSPAAGASPAQAQAQERFRRFNTSFEEAYRKQSESVVPDTNLREEILASVGGRLVQAYREFYEAHRHAIGEERSVGLFVRYAPEDLENYLSELFYGTGGDVGSTSSTSSSTSSNRHHSWSR